jgi:hypothetical protein
VNMGVMIHLMGALLAGLIAVIGEITIRRHMIEPVVEKPHIPNECVKYRRTHVNMISVFLLGVMIYVVSHAIHVGDKI